MNILSDLNCERALLAGLINYGSSSHHEIAAIGISDNTFTIDSHRVIFKCLSRIFSIHDNVKPDIPLIYSAASDIALRHWFQKDEEVQYLTSLQSFPVDEKNVINFAKKIKKLEAGRNIFERLEKAKTDICQINGDESINEIFGVIENNLIDCNSFLSSQDKGSTNLGDGMKEYFTELEKNPIEQIGISTGMPLFDKVIGGGLRAGSVDVVAARAGVGKSSMAINIAKSVSELDIPILYLDSEMSKKDTWGRLIACLSSINNNEIETGQYIKFTTNQKKVHEAIDKVKKLPFHYESIAGQNIENQISIIKRWLISKVGLKKDGTSNKCVIIYDYLKLMNQDEGKGYQETQMMGFIMTSLVNLAQKYNFAILAFVQANRDGIDREDSGVISQSDRIYWFASSLSIFKPKSYDEIQKDGYDVGNRKLIILKSRFGPGLKSNEYINIKFSGAISKIIEGKSNYEILKENRQKEAAEINDNNIEQDEIPF